MGLRSAPGAFGVVNPFVWGRPAGSLQFPPEAWQRVQWAWQRWLSRHEGLARGLLRLSRISQRITIVLLVVAVLVVPRLWWRRRRRGTRTAISTAAMILASSLVSLLLGVSTATASTPVGPHEATWSTTLDSTVTLDLGPL